MPMNGPVVTRIKKNSLHDTQLVEIASYSFIPKVLQRFTDIDYNNCDCERLVEPQ